MPPLPEGREGFLKMNIEHRTSNVQLRMKNKTPLLKEVSAAISVSFRPF